MNNRNRIDCPKYHAIVSKKSVKSHVWQFFGCPGDENGKIIKDGVAICKLCKIGISSKATSNLWSHMRNNHPAKYHALNSR